MSHAGLDFLGLESLSEIGKNGLLIEDELLVSRTDVGLMVDSTGEKPPFEERPTKRCLGERNGDGVFGLFLCWWFALGEGSGDDLFLSIIIYSSKTYTKKLASFVWEQKRFVKVCRLFVGERKKLICFFLFFYFLFSDFEYKFQQRIERSIKVIKKSVVDQSPSIIGK